MCVERGGGKEGEGGGGGGKQINSISIYCNESIGNM
jgi:hypothetical protein